MLDDINIHTTHNLLWEIESSMDVPRLTGLQHSNLYV